MAISFTFVKFDSITAMPYHQFMTYEDQSFQT